MAKNNRHEDNCADIIYTQINRMIYTLFIKDPVGIQ